MLERQDTNKPQRAWSEATESETPGTIIDGRSPAAYAIPDGRETRSLPGSLPDLLVAALEAGPIGKVDGAARQVDLGSWICWSPTTSIGPSDSRRTDGRNDVPAIATVSGSAVGSNDLANEDAGRVQGDGCHPPDRARPR